MTVKKIFESELIESRIINDTTEIYIRDSDGHVLTCGNWFQDNVLEYLNHLVECFTWQDDNKFYVDLK